MVTLLFRKTAVPCLVLFSVVLFASPASAVIIPVSPAGDGEVRFWQTVLGQSGYQAISSAATITTKNEYAHYSGYNYDQEDYRYGIVEIPISSLAGMNLTGASITFHFYALLVPQWQYLFGGRFEGDGVVTVADYWRVPGYADANHALLAWYGPHIQHIMYGGWNSVDASSYIKAQLASGYNWATFQLRAPPDSEFDPAQFAAAEDSQHRGSYLQVIPVPEPSSLLALFAGASCIGGMIIRRRK